jgi:hypothetical protein
MPAAIALDQKMRRARHGNCDLEHTVAVGGEPFASRLAVVEAMTSISRPLTDTSDTANMNYTRMLLTPLLPGCN